jgi:predicted AlkP superfamily phosphohydrolase/phosphomutase
MDRAVGQALTRLDADTSLIVLSDHGFAPYHRSFNLNTWLLENGYLALKPGIEPGAAGDFLVNVDWSRTRAYGIGLNSLYLNLRGREREGIVAAGPQADALLAELRARLLELADSAGREDDCRARQDCRRVPAPRVLGRVDRATDAYSGAQLPHAPDLVLGYNRGYRAGWSTVLGGFSRAVLEDNLEAWSGDHCMDFTQVPGVLLSSRKITAPAPALTDVAPTILAEFGIAAPKEMTGRPLW